MFAATRLRRGAARLLLALVLGAAALAVVRPAAVTTHALAAPAETRGLWVLRSSLTSPASIASLVQTAADQGFNTLLVQVRGRGDAYYASGLEPRASDLSRQPGSFDPLATVLAEAHERHLRVHAWISLNLISSAFELPVTPDHIVNRHPEWLMVPRPIAQELAKLDPGNPAYVGKIARWTRGESETVEGLYATPVQPEAAAYTLRIVADLARRYELDGIHLDYARFPNQQFDYSRFTIAEFRSDLRARIAPDVRRELDAQEEADLFAYPDRFPAEWKAFRRARLTSLIGSIRQAVHNARPSAIVSAAVYPDAQEAFDERLQDWRGWIGARFVDAVAPMAYTQEASRFADQIEAVKEIAGGPAVWAGIGAYRLSPTQTIDNIQATRRIGTAGFVLFSYDSLTGPKPPAADYLAIVSRGAFAAPMSLPNGK